MSQRTSRNRCNTKIASMATNVSMSQQLNAVVGKNSLPVNPSCTRGKKKTPGEWMIIPFKIPVQGFSNLLIIEKRKTNSSESTSSHVKNECFKNTRSRNTPTISQMIPKNRGMVSLTFLHPGLFDVFQQQRHHIWVRTMACDMSALPNGHKVVLLHDPVSRAIKKNND